LVRVWTLGRICEDLSLEVIAVDLGGGRRLWRHDAVDPKTIQYVDIIGAHAQLGCGLLAVVLRMTVRDCHHTLCARLYVCFRLRAIELNMCSFMRNKRQ